MVRKLVLAVAAASALLSSGMVQALSVGDIKLRSALNQPLEAEIELLQVRDLTSSDIRSVLASADAFGKAGIDRAFFLTDLTFTPMVNAAGKSVIKVTSSKPVKEPYLNFLMEVRWPSGRVLREFTLLLDPPMYQPTPVTAQPIRPAMTAEGSSTGRLPRPVPEVRSPAQVSQPRAVTNVPAAPQQTSAPRELRAARNDTLWEIALNNRPSGATVHQTMLAIQELNPNAFIAGNINSLKAGQVLTLPTADQANSRSRAEALAEVANQNALWGKQQSAPQTAARQLDARERTQADAAPDKVPSDDALRLVAGDNEASGDGVDSATQEGLNGLRDALDRSKEQLDSAEREKAELSERLEDMQGQLQTLQRLLELKDAQLAALQQELSGTEVLPDILPVPADSADGLAEQSVAQQLSDAEQVVIPESQVELSATGIDTEAPVVGAEAGQPAVAEQTAEPAEPASFAEPTPAVDDQRLDSKSPEALLQRFMQNQSVLLGAGAVALLLLLLILMAVARRNARRELELSAATDGVSPAPTHTIEEDEGDFEMAFAEEIATGNELDIHQDPLTEADALIAYAKLDQAAEVLAAAIEQEPTRADLRLKMMEVEALRENPQGYSEQADALRDAGVAQESVDMMNLRYPLMAAGLMTGAMLLDDNAQPVSDDVPPSSVVDMSGEEDGEGPSSSQRGEDDFDFSDFDVEEGAGESASESASTLDSDFDFEFDLDELSADEASVQPDGSVSDDFAANESSTNQSTDASSSDQAVNTEDLVLDEELQAANLLAEFEALNSESNVEEESGPTSEGADDEHDFSLSDEDLAGFEAELQTAMASEAQKSDESPTAETGYDALEDDLDDEFGFLADTDESATKLDLARAYIDMGDEEGARDILTEVVAEGNEQQQQDAREMMEQLN